MRITTALSVAALAVSTAALAQVASTPTEQKTGQNEAAGNIAGPDTTANTAATNTTPADPAAAHAGHDMQDSTMGNTAATTPPR